MNSKEYFYELGKLLYKIDNFYDEYAKVSKVKNKLLWVLYALNDGNIHSQKEISSSWLLPRTTVNTIIKELKEEGYVELKQIKGEKRELNLILTSSGREYANNLLSELYEIEKGVFNKMTSSNLLKQMNEILEKLYSEKNKLGGKNKNGKRI